MLCLRLQQDIPVVSIFIHPFGAKGIFQEFHCGVNVAFSVHQKRDHRFSVHIQMHIFHFIPGCQNLLLCLYLFHGESCFLQKLPVPDDCVIVIIIGPVLVKL